MENALFVPVQDKKIAGVCAGIGDYFNMDHTTCALWIIFHPTMVLESSLCCSLLPSSRRQCRINHRE